MPGLESLHNLKYNQSFSVFLIKGWYAYDIHFKGGGEMGAVGQVKTDMSLDVEDVSKSSGCPVFILLKKKEDLRYDQTSCWSKH